MMRIGRVVAALAVTSTLAVAGCAGPASPPITDSPAATVTPVAPELPEPAEPLPLAQLAAFSGVAALNAGSNCTGTLIDTGVASGPAYVLTNGHCVGDVGRSPQTTTHEIEWAGTAEFLAAKGNSEATLSVDVVGLAYSTMRHTDTAILRLKPTLGELTTLGIRPVLLTVAEPAANTPVTNVGVPVQDLTPEDWVLRRGECTLGAQKTLIEHLWLWFGVWSNDCPGITQGSSGSPLFKMDGDKPSAIVAMINTTTGGASAANGGACSINRPCEVTTDGVQMVEKTSYAQSVAGLGKCFNSAGQFALAADCPLSTSSVWAENGGGAFRGGSLPDAMGRLPETSLVGREASTVRTALVPLGDATACQLPATYDDTSPKKLPKAGEPWEVLGVKVAVELPETEGHYLLCAAAGSDYAGAAAVLYEVDRTPPLFPAAADIEDLGEGAVLVQPHLNPPEIATVRFTWGDPATLDCDDTADFRDFFIVPLLLEPGDLPAKYCVYGMDAAGNPTEVTRMEIPKP